MYNPSTKPKLTFPSKLVVLVLKFSLIKISSARVTRAIVQIQNLFTLKIVVLVLKL